jgi:hypothetical protein
MARIRMIDCRSASVTGEPAVASDAAGGVPAAVSAVVVEGWVSVVVVAEGCADAAAAALGPAGRRRAST